MAVPASGSISLGGLAFEKLEEDYSNGLPSSIDTSYGPFSLRDITLGGATTVNAEDYDVTNSISPSHPDNEASYGMSEFYSYDHDYAGSGGSPANFIMTRNASIKEHNFPINLGTGLGWVRIEYQAYTRPVSFKFVTNNIHYSSGIQDGSINNTVNDGFVGHQSYLSALRTATGKPNLLIKSYTTSDYDMGSNDSGYLWNQQQGGRYFMQYYKNSNDNDVITINVKQPIGVGTGFWFSVSKPGGDTQDHVFTQITTGHQSAQGQAPTHDPQGQNNTSPSTSKVTMTGNIQHKGLKSDFSTVHTITSKGFVYSTDPNINAEVNGYPKSDRWVPHGSSSLAVNKVWNSNGGDYGPSGAVMNETGAFTGLTSDLGIGTGAITTNNASSITDSSFVSSVTVTSVGAIPLWYKAYAKNGDSNLNPGSFSYSKRKETSTTGYADQIGTVYCNQSYSSTPSAAVSGGVLTGSTGNQFTAMSHNHLFKGTVTGNVNEDTVSLISNNSYKYRAVMRQGSSIVYGLIKSFTVAASYSYTSTITVGSDQYYTTLAYGFADLSWPDMGSISNSSFNSNTLLGVYWQNNASGTDYVYLVFMGSKPSFTELIIGSTNLGASSSWTSQSSTMWRKAQSSNPFAGSGGTTTVQASY